MRTHFIVIFIISAVCILQVPLFPQTYAPLYESGAVTKVTDLTIGGEPTDGTYLFAQPSAVAVDSDNNIYVLDSQESRIRKFGPDGRVITTISGPGQGPGEILRCYQMTMLADDRLVTFDFGNMRFSIFRPDGAFERSVSLTEIFSFRMFPYRIDADDSGNLYVETHTIMRNSSDGDIYKIWQIGGDFAEAHVVDSCYVKDNEWIRDENRSRNRIIPFAPKFHWSPLPGGRLVTGRAGSYELRVYGPDRGLIRTFTHDAKQRRVTSDDKETFFSGITYSTSGSSEVRHGADEETRKKTVFPSRMPFFMYIQADQDGNILCTTSESDNGRVLYDVFSPDGVFIRRLPLPPLAAKAVFKNGSVYAVETTEADEPVVVKCHWE
ncbi:hypothetical protein JXO52_06360 [bacterium]|nr:hypothetical protein [bacterium]